MLHRQTCDNLIGGEDHKGARGSKLDTLKLEREENGSGCKGQIQLGDHRLHVNSAWLTSRYSRDVHPRSIRLLQGRWHVYKFGCNTFASRHDTAFNAPEVSGSIA
jgi:hypothetical protein